MEQLIFSMRVCECLWIYRAIYGYILDILCLRKPFVSPPACPSIVNYASTWLRLAALCCSLSRKLLVAGNLEPVNHIYMPQTRRDTTHITTLHTFSTCAIYQVPWPPVNPALCLLIGHRLMWQAGQINANCRMPQLPATVARHPPRHPASICPYLICMHCKIEVQSFPKFKSDKSLWGGQET